MNSCSKTSRIAFAVFAAAVSVASWATAARPSIPEGSVVMTPSQGRAVVTYVLEGAPAIVTMDVQTNAGAGVWASIGGAAFASGLSGDVSRVVETGSRTILWKASETWPDRTIPAGGIRAVLTAWPTNDPPDYMVVDSAGAISHYADADSVPGGVMNEVYRRSKFLMRRIRATGARFTMGSPVDEEGRVTNVKETPHLVTLTNDYYMGVFEVTQDQWRLSQAAWNSIYFFTNLSYSAVMPIVGADFSEIRGGEKTVGALWSSTNSLSVAHQVTTSSFMGKMRAMTGVDFDLPTDAEWEYACRAGSTGPFYGSALQTEEVLGEIAWYAGNSASEDAAIAYPTDPTSTTPGILPRPGGLKNPNAWGLYDMLGNVSELCLDWSQYDLGSAAVVAPMGGSTPASGKCRSIRGGSYCDSAAKLRIAYRGGWQSINTHRCWMGLRLSCPCPATKKW